MQNAKNPAPRRVELEGCPNFRDLGGYACAGGKTTRSGRFYRADCLSKLTGRDIDALKKRGVRCVVDLRAAYETTSAPNRLQGQDGFVYYNISLLDGAQSQGFSGQMPKSLAEMYFALTDFAAPSIAEVMRVFLKESGGVVFHCTAGKDRTGVIAALLLLLAGVDEETIVQDYALTHELMEKVFASQAEMARHGGIEIPDYLFLSPPDQMQMLLVHMKETYGDIAGYLRFAGLSDGEIAALKNDLTEEG